MLKRLFLSICAVLLCSTSLFSQGDAILSSDYNLGRIIGEGPLENHTEMITNPDFVLTDLYLAQNGRDRKYNLGLGLYGLLGRMEIIDEYGYIENHSAFYLGLPLLYMNLVPNHSHRLGISSMPLNLYIALSNKGNLTGLSAPLTMLNSYKWNYLSKGGEIKVDEKNFDQVFYLTSLLNENQFKFDFSLTHPFSTVRFDLFDLQTGLQYGILDNWQIQADFLLSHIPFQEDFAFSNVHLETGTKFRLGNMNANADYILGFDFGQQIIKTEANYISSSDLSSNQIDGNWDGYFSNNLKKGQLRAGLAFSTEYKGSVKTVMLLTGNAGYGFTDQFTLSSDLTFRNLNRIEGTLRSTFMNIAKRDYGPSEASKFEYLYGYQPRAGEIKADLWVKLPFMDDTTLFEELMNREVRFDYKFFLPSSETQNPFTYRLETLPGTNCGVSFSAGITKNIVFNNDLQFRFLKTTSDGSRDYLSNYYNLFKLSLIKPNHLMYSLGTGLCGDFESDPYFTFKGDLEAAF